nr:uncharacterized protein LOC105490730 isoform X1 [Macaca nemestrina]
MWNCILCWLNANGSRRKREPLTPCSYRLASRADSRWRVESGAEGQTAVALAVSNKSIKSEHPCLAPNHRGKPFSFSPLIMMLAVGFSHVGFIVLRVTEDVPFSMFSLLYLHVQAREAPDMYDNGRELQVRKPARS